MIMSRFYIKRRHLLYLDRVTLLSFFVLATKHGADRWVGFVAAMQKDAVVEKQ